MQNKAELIESLKSSFFELEFYYDSNLDAEVQLLTVDEIEFEAPDIIEVGVYHSIVSFQAAIKFNAFL